MVSLEVAKKLKEAGWEEKTDVCYYEDLDYEDLMRTGETYAVIAEGIEVLFAPTLTEILEGLPVGVALSRDAIGYMMHKLDNIQVVGRHQEQTILASSMSTWERNPADAAALAWIELQK